MVVCMKTGESLASIVDSVLEENLVNDSATIAYIYWGSQTCFPVIDGKLLLKHAPASKKKWYKQDWKTLKM